MVSIFPFQRVHGFIWLIDSDRDELFLPSRSYPTITCKYLIKPVWSTKQAWSLTSQFISLTKKNSNIYKNTEFSVIGTWLLSISSSQSFGERGTRLQKSEASKKTPQSCCLMNKSLLGKENGRIFPSKRTSNTKAWEQVITDLFWELLRCSFWWLLLVNRGA